MCVKRDWKTTCELLRRWAGSAVIMNMFLLVCESMAPWGHSVAEGLSVQALGWKTNGYGKLPTASWMQCVYLGEPGLAEIAVVASWS